MSNPQKENQVTHRMRATKIPGSKPLLNITNVGRHIETPRSSKDDGKPHIGRRLVPPSKIKKSTTSFSCTQVIQYNFSTNQLPTQPSSVSSVHIANSTQLLPFMFHGSDENKMPRPTVQFKQFKRGLVKLASMDRNDRNGRKDKIQPIISEMSQLRLQQHRDLFKSNFTKTRRPDNLRGVRLNRRFDLQMKFREGTGIMKSTYN